MEIRKNNKRKSLIMHIMSIVLWVVMLAGGTFAWFSDHATGNNIIQTGNLDVELKHVAKDGTTEAVTETTELFLNENGEAIKWEPGAVATETFVVENAGDLALIYELGLSFKEDGIDDTHYLRKYMKVAFVEATVDATTGAVTPVTVSRESVVDGTLEGLTAYDEADFGKKRGSLPNGGGAATQKAYTVVVYWAPQEGNLDNIFNIAGGYQIDLGIELNATQMAPEYDSLGNGYDDNLEIPSTPEGTVTPPDENESGDPFGR
mgnify:CR=1 FL=1